MKTAQAQLINYSSSVNKELLIVHVELCDTAIYVAYRQYA